MPSDTSFAFFASGLSEVPGILLAWITTKYFGRWSIMVGSLFVTGVLTLATGFVPDGIWTFVNTGDNFRSRDSDTYHSETL